jgi:hypothetical protein
MLNKLESNDAIKRWFDSAGDMRFRGIHLGCGAKYKAGWCNVDYLPSEISDTHRGATITPDIWCDILNLPCEDGFVDVTYSSHVIEHFYRHEAIRLFDELARVLKPGAIMINEMPDLSRILALTFILPFSPRYTKDVGADRDLIQSQLYGASWESNDKGYPYHKFVWKRKELCTALTERGWKILLETGATQSHVPFRDMAIIAQRPGSPSDETTVINDLFLTEYGGKIQRLSRQLRSLKNLCQIGFKQRLFSR